MARFYLGALLLQLYGVLAMQLTAMQLASTGGAAYEDTKGDDAELGDKPKVAYCMSGASRTFAEPKVWQSLNWWLRSSGARGIMNKDLPDLYAYMSMEDHTHYGRDHVDNSKTKLVHALQTCNAVKWTLVESPEDITVDMLDSVVTDFDKCFKNAGYWGGTHEHMVNSMNQLKHQQSCVQLIFDTEAKRAEKYDVVVITRPDMEYVEKAYDGFFHNVRDGQGLFMHDHWVAMPRPTANRFQPHGNKLLVCKVGERCCNRITRSEDMMEFLVGFPVEGKSCNCLLDKPKNATHVEGYLFDIFGDSYNLHDLERTRSEEKKLPVDADEKLPVDADKKLPVDADEPVETRAWKLPLDIDGDDAAAAKGAAMHPVPAITP